ncbi:MAG: hypothetical protein IMY82_07450, partial [Chloroflexi bacterium]|nr:hypothetical protein [Chloroflexota bacterium]
MKRKIHSPVFAIVLITSLVISYSFFCVAFSITNEYYRYHHFFKLVTIITPILAAFVTTLFLSNSIFPTVHRRFTYLVAAENSITKIICAIISSIVILGVFGFAYQIATSKTVLVKSNDNAGLTVVNGATEHYVGVIPQNKMIEILIPEGTLVLLFDNNKQVVRRNIETDNLSEKLIVVDFELYTSEVLDTQKDQYTRPRDHSLERLEKANDDLSGVLLHLDAARTPEGEIITRLAGYVSRDLKIGRLDHLLALIYKTYIQYREGYILGKWCDDALGRIYSSNEDVEITLSIVRTQYGGCNEAEQVLLLKFLEVAMKKNLQFQRDLRVLMEHLRNASEAEIAAEASEIEKHGTYINFIQIFQRKYDEIASVENTDTSGIEVREFKIAEEFSIYREKQYGRVREYEIHTERRTFLTDFRDNGILGGSSDYLDFIEITNKIARKEHISFMEEAFLKKAKPVFVVTISNQRDRDVLLQNVILIIDSIEVVYGGGTKILQPDIMYELEVPTKTGRHVFPIKTNQLLVGKQSFGQFYLGLNSTNRKVLRNGAVMYPQLNYWFEIILD